MTDHLTEAEQIIKSAERALCRASAPICYLHRDGTEGMFAALVEIEHWRKIIDLIPENRKERIEDLVMNHGHIEGDEDNPPVANESVTAEGWVEMMKSWPLDGWDGAVAAITTHNQRVCDYEAELDVTNPGWREKYELPFTPRSRPRLP